MSADNRWELQVADEKVSHARQSLREALSGFKHWQATPPKWLVEHLDKLDDILALFELKIQRAVEREVEK